MFYVITDGKGGYVTRKSTQSGLSITKDFNFAYTWTDKEEAEDAASRAEKILKMDLQVEERSSKKSYLKTYEEFHKIAK